MVKRDVSFNGGNQLIVATNRSVSATMGDAQLLVSTIVAQMVDSQSPIEQTQIDGSKDSQMYKELVKVYIDGELLDCTIAVPKANREFEVKRRFFIGIFWTNFIYAGFTVSSFGSLAHFPSNTRRRHGGDEKQARCHRGFRRRYRRATRTLHPHQQTQ